MAKNNLDGKIYEYKKEYESDLAAHDRFIVEWDANEAMLISKTYDSVSKQTKNGITDSEAATMIIERSARVVGQLPDGETEAAGKKDKGKAILMDIIRQRWIYPNANAQRPFLDKIRLWEMYSGVYGEMPMFYDWDVSPSGYSGPNCWLWNPRNFIPQQGKYTIDDMEYAHAISYMSEKDLRDIYNKLDDKSFAKESGWNRANIFAVLETIKNKSKDQDNHRNTFVERNRSSDTVKGRVQIVTRFESGDDGKWVTFSPDYNGLELRNIDNPHKNGKIPFVIKPSIPLLDSFYNLAEMTRAKPIQFAKDGLTNFYFQGIKMNIYPPTVVNAQGILRHTVSNEPGSIWEEIIPNSARRLETSTAGLSTFQAAMGMMNGSLQNVFGTTTTQMNSESAMSPQFGKTPEALKYQQGRESARDNQNRAYLQTAIETLIDRFMELIVNVGGQTIDISLFSEDIKEIVKEGYDDVLEMIVPNESRRSGRLLIKPQSLRGVTYRFNMKPDSTVRVTKDERKQSLLEFMGVLSKHQNELDNIFKQTGEHVNWRRLFEMYAELADIPGLDEIFVQGEKPQEQNPLLQLIEKLNIKFEKLPQDSQNFLLAQLGIPANGQNIEQQNTDIKAQEVQIKAQEAGAKVQDSMTRQQDAETKALDASTRQIQAHSGILAQHEQQQPAPAAPQTVNGMVFNDPTLHSAANDLNGMRPQSQSMVNLNGKQ